MNRMEEFEALGRELEKEPAQLEFTVTRAKARARRRRAARWTGIPVGTLAGVFAAFVLLVNTSMSFALACSGLPILGDLAAAVDWSGSLKAAVEHQYVQTIGQSQTKDGITVTVEYVIVDQKQLNIFFTTESGDPAMGYAAAAVDVVSQVPEHAVLTYGEQKNGALRRVTVDFGGQTDMPGDMTLRIAVKPFAGMSDYPERGEAGRTEFLFDIAFDPTFTESGRTYPIGQWVELDGQRIYADRLEVYPSHARLILADDPDNTMGLVDLDFYLEDERGVRYESEGGLGGYSDPATDFAFDRRVGSPWFSKGDRLTLCITGVSWLDTEDREVRVDLGEGTAENLPEGVTLEEVIRQGGRTGLKFKVPALPDGAAFFLFDGYLDPEGGVHELGSGTASTNDEEPGVVCNQFWLEDYGYDTVTLQASRTLWHRLDETISLAVK